jgi:hypothetical protein
MSQSVELPKGLPGYKYDVYKIAKYFNTDAVFGYTEDGKTFVLAKNVWGNTKPHTSVVGLGTTHEDACEDFMRKIRGMELLNIITDKTGSFV